MDRASTRSGASATIVTSEGAGYFHAMPEEEGEAKSMSEQEGDRLRLEEAG